MQELDDLESTVPLRAVAKPASHDALATALARERARRQSDELVGRFVLDPVAFARSANAEPVAFVEWYRQSLDRRLAAVTPTRTDGRPALATAGASSFAATGSPADDVAPDTVRMGVVVAMVVGSAVALVGALMAVSAVSSALAAMHRPL